MQNLDIEWTTHPDGLHSAETILETPDAIVMGLGTIRQEGSLLLASANNRTRWFNDFSFSKAQAWVEEQTTDFVKRQPRRS